ncbi:ADP-ribosylation factor-like protein 3 [Trichoplax sp. H2]|nr:ADP-ribosylation factor-like protein 3 [Trichoplax sp. H2]|eukprot:RDD43551.1 ADP-ribosylation factor-like protein 3 [Trichoplax sp. H2]
MGASDGRSPGRHNDNQPSSVKKESKGEKMALCAVGGATLAYILYKWYQRPTTSHEEELKETEEIEEATAEFDEYRKGNSNKVLALGLPASGKSSMVARFIYDEAKTEYEPTNGFNIKNMSMDGKTVEIWEIGGSMSKYWYTYLPGTGVLVFVIDASDSSNFPAVRLELQKLFDNDGLKLEKTKFVLLLNKQDLTGGSLDKDTINSILPNESCMKDHVVKIVQTSLLQATVDEFNTIKNTVLELLYQ